MGNEILEFQKSCFANYISDIRKQISEIPNPYIYPDGNPIRPVVPTKTFKNGIMIIGAFPSARFEKRNKVLIPVGDNLSPFGHEEYFDGTSVRRQASRESLDKSYFPQLQINLDEVWITDIVKIYLFPPKHIKNCELVNPHGKFVDTHKLFSKIASASLEWMAIEIQVCNPKLIITLGEVAARVISGDSKTKNTSLLNGDIRPIKFDRTYQIAHLGHPEIRRINKDWDKLTGEAIIRLSQKIKSIY